MKTILIFSFVILVGQVSFSQSQKMIQRSWIKVQTENLSNDEMDLDTLYTRYTFNKTKLYMSFYPGWNDYEQSWSVNGNSLSTGFATYKIEDLTDTSLTISQPGFRRFKFLSEDYISSQEVNLILIGEYNEKPLYKATNYISPRYFRKISLGNIIQKSVEGYNIKKATHFMATFVVTELGEVENVQIVKGISDGFDRDITKELLKTSKGWKPAYYQGKAIQTEMVYEIKYLNSLTPTNFGELN